MNDDMKTMVLQVINRSEIVKKVHCKIGLAYVSPRYYRRLKDAIEEGKIRVVHDRRLSTPGAYLDGSNTLKLKFNELPSDLFQKVASEALILHECTHAALDVRGLRRMVLHAEALAFVAQMLYSYYRLQGKFDSGAAIAPSSGIPGAAWEVSKTLREKGGNTITESEAKPLFDAIKASGLYGKSWQDDYNYDGV